MSSAKSKQCKTPEEQEAADQAKAEKKAQTAAKRKANEGQKAEVMTLVSRFGIEDEAWSHLVQDRWPTPNVIAATYLLVLTLVQYILKRAIDMNAEDIGAEAVMRGWRQQEGILRLGMRSLKPCRDSMVKTFKAMIAAESLTVETDQSTENLEILYALIWVIFDPDFVEQQAEEKKSAARNIRSRLMKAYSFERDIEKAGVEKWDDPYTEEDWEKFKSQNSHFRDAAKGRNREQAFHVVVCEEYTMTTREAHMMDALAETGVKLDDKWFNEEKFAETLEIMITTNGSDIKVTPAGRRQLLEAIMHTFYNCITQFKLMADHRGNKRKIAEVDREGATAIMEKESLHKFVAPKKKRRGRGRALPNSELPDKLTAFNDMMKKNLVLHKQMIDPQEGGAFSKFM